MSPTRLALPPDLAHSIDFAVTRELQTDVYGALSEPVLATAQMIAMMERAAVFCIADLLPAGHITVGFEVCVRHVASAAANSRCVAKAVLREVRDERKLRFDVEVLNDTRTVGLGTHERRLIPVPAPA
jgi:fluoroacetyl-CoA thioesterase